jgi:hypothetical protein
VPITIAPLELQLKGLLENGASAGHLVEINVPA